MSNQTNNKRTQLIYGNCSVYNPEGELMFRCLLKRAKWYLDRGLAKVIEEDPLSIKLNFKPKGNGEQADFLLLPRENKCIVCGTKDLKLLSRHHLIPYEYRKFFPESKKSANSAYVVPICRDDHNTYEAEATILKKKIAKQYNAPLNGKISCSQTTNLIKTLLRHGDKIPVKRAEEMRERLLEQLKELYSVSKEDLYDHEYLESIYDILETERNNVDHCHGKIVVSQLEDLDEFVKRWCSHFFNIMKPRYAPEDIKRYFGIE